MFGISSSLVFWICYFFTCSLSGKSCCCSGSDGILLASQNIKNRCEMTCVWRSRSNYRDAFSPDYIMSLENSATEITSYWRERDHEKKWVTSSSTWRTTHTSLPSRKLGKRRQKGFTVIVDPAWAVGVYVSNHVVDVFLGEIVRQRLQNPSQFVCVHLASFFFV